MEHCRGRAGRNHHTLGEEGKKPELHVSGVLATVMRGEEWVSKEELWFKFAVE